MKFRVQMEVDVTVEWDELVEVTVTEIAEHWAMTERQVRAHAAGAGWDRLALEVAQEKAYEAAPPAISLKVDRPDVHLVTETDPVPGTVTLEDTP